MKDFLPDHPEGEDERSMELHMSRIQKIQRLSIEKQDKLRINRFMDINFFHRRRLLVTEFVKVQTWLKCIPFFVTRKRSNSTFVMFYRILGLP